MAAQWAKVVVENHGAYSARFSVSVTPSDGGGPVTVNSGSFTAPQHSIQFPNDSTQIYIDIGDDRGFGGWHHMGTPYFQDVTTWPLVEGVSTATYRLTGTTFHEHLDQDF